MRQYQKKGIFFIPIATTIMAGFFFPKVSATGAKAGLAFGLFFYTFVNFQLEVDLHFVHIWGIEFILNIIVMHAVSYAIPRTNNYTITDVGAVQLVPWKHTKSVSILLLTITVLLYVVLGNVG